MLKSKILAALMGGVLFLGGCTAMAAEAPPEINEVPSGLYRGEVTEIREDGSLLVAQVDGYNYGQPSILFHVDENTVTDSDGFALAEGAYVEIEYNGLLARSLPAQGMAQQITVLSSFSEGVVVNGILMSVTMGEDYYTLNLLPFGADDSALQNQVILQVPKDALQGLGEADLVEGAQLSAVTKGVAALSLPPQMPVVALMPYLPAQA